MPRQKTLRFAAGSPEAPSSSVWHVSVNKDDVYIGSSKDAMSLCKVSLHKSGVWTLAFTQQSGIVFDGNRRSKRWERPPEHAAGITRGPSIVAVGTSVARRLPLIPEYRRDDIMWFHSPQPGEFTEFSFYFVAPHGVEDWRDGEKSFAERTLANGSRLLLFCNVRDGSLMQESVDSLIRKNVFDSNRPEDSDGSLIIYSERADAESGTLTIPMFFELPLAIRQRGWVALKPTD
jgi:hypothetical protein